MAVIKRFEELDSWKLAYELYQRIAQLIESGRMKRNYGLIDQVERSSGSIMDNIAEGFERGTRREFITFLGYAKGSCGELRSQLHRALIRNYVSLPEFDDISLICIRVSAMLQKFIAYLQKTPVQGTRKK
jgi:four helix bundle protein